MPSKLTNLFKTLTWQDFKTVQRNDPGPTTVAEAAEIPVRITHTGMGIAHVKGGVTLADTLTVNVVFGNATVSSWVFNKDQAFQDNLLKHEQGHYDIVALIARDWFLAMMQLKAKVFADAAELQREINTLDVTIRSKSQPIVNKYDSDTQRGTDSAQQARWNAFFSRAFTTSATPPAATPDGTPIKVTLLSVLAAGGVRV